MSQYKFIAIFILVFVSITAVSVGLTAGMDRLVGSLISAEIDNTTPDKTKTPTPTPTKTGSPQDVLDGIKDAINPTVTASPSKTPTVSKTPAPTVIKTATPAPSKTPSPTPTPTPTKAPTPTPTPSYPTACSVELEYKIGTISSVYFEKGFSRGKLNEIVSDAEKKWEDAVGKSLFKKTDSASNEIIFSSTPITSNAEGYGSLNIEKSYPNGTIQNFDVTIYSALFTYAENSGNGYVGPATNTEKLREYLLKKNVMKQMGHALGVQSVKSSDVKIKESIMVGFGGWVMTSTDPKLSADDIALAKKNCGN